MANLEVAYYTRDQNLNMPGAEIAAETIATLSATSQQSGATPDNADYVKITANGADARYSYSGTGSIASAATPYLVNGDSEWRPAHAGWKVAAITG